MKSPLLALVLSGAAFGLGSLSGCSSEERGADSVEAAVEAAMESQDYRFMALMDEGVVYPEISEMPEDYFKRGGRVFMQKTDAEHRESDLAFMKSYNQLLFEQLKAENKVKPLLQGKIPPVTRKAPPQP